jgi:putative transcriptional regulator
LKRDKKGQIMELNIDFFHVVNENIAEKGRILISEPFLGDHYFRRSIVYLTEHNKEGSMGFVLNKPLEINISEIVDGFPDTPFPISVGGPVSNNTVHYIHTLGSLVPESVEVTDGIWWGGDFDQLKQLIANGSVQPHQSLLPGIRRLVGRAARRRVEENAWLVGTIGPQMVMKGV